MNLNDEIKVQLTSSTDMNRPVLDAKVARLCARGKPRAVVVEKSAHAVWGGCMLKIYEQCMRVL